MAVLVCLACWPAVAGAASRSWSAPIALDTTGGTPTLFSISCPSTTQCTADDTLGQELTFNPQAPGSLTAVSINVSGYVSCPTVSQCTAVDQGGEITFDPQSPGVPAAPVQIDNNPDNGINGLSCPTVTQCTAVDYTGRESTFNPQAPSSPSVTVIDAGNGGFGGIVCPSATQCTAADTNGNEVTFDPQTVSGAVTPVLVDAPNYITALSCPSATQCTVVDQSGSEVTFNPQSPPATTPTPAVIDGSAYMDAVSCPTASQCTAVDDTQEVTFTPTTGTVTSGPTATDTTPSNTFQDAIACPTASQCTSVDYVGQEITFAPLSASGASPVAIDTRQALTTVACPSQSQCTAVDHVGREFTFDPATGVVIGGPVVVDPISPTSNSGVTSVACPSLTECVVVDVFGGEATFDPTTGTAPPSATTIDPPGTTYQSNLLDAVSCPSASQCTATDSHGHEITFDPSAPANAHAPVMLDTALLGVSCPSTTQCTAVDFSKEVTFDPTTGTVITALTAIDDVGAIQGGIACPSTNRCTAVDTAGQEMTFNPASPPVTPTPTVVYPQGSLDKVTCPSASDCVATTFGATLVEGDPARPDSWTTEQIPLGNSLGEVSCSWVAQCVAVDGAGNAFVGTNSTSTAVICAPASITVGAATSCTATVTDQGAVPSTPSGTVSFASDGPGTFGAARCALTGGSAGQASCGVSYTATAVSSGSHRITASYVGDSTHPSSSGGTTVGVHAGPGGARPPAARTGGASRVGQLRATVLGTVNPEGSRTSYAFQYGRTASYGRQTERQAVGAGTEALAVSSALGDLRAGTTFHYRIVAYSAAGTAYGSDARFTTKPKVAPRGLSHHASPHRALSAPYHFHFSGRLVLPRGMARGDGCQGIVIVQITRGRQMTWSHRSRLSPSCGYSARATLSVRRLPGRGRLTVTVRFLGNRVLTSRRDRPFHVLFG